MDRNWITQGRKFTPPYVKGVNEFMKFVREHFNADESILCPCIRCLNLIRQNQTDVEAHINCNGMSVTYTRWIFHWEALSDDESHSSDHGAYQSDDDDDYEQDDAINFNDVPGMVDDLHNSGKKGSGGSNLYSKLMEEAKRELHEGCSTFTRLAFIIRLLHIKSYNRFTNRGFDQFLQLFSAALPSVNLPKSYVEAKRVLSEVGLGYQTIHVCKFDCALFWGDHANNTHCPVCGLSRWKNIASKKKVPHKVLRYFPIIPRFQRFFVSKEMSGHTKWHKDKRVVEENVMRHPTDGEAWKDFDTNFGWFAEDPRNLKLGIATDGFNPFGHMSSSYSMWPVFVIPYNLPPWMCMDQSNFMMALLIPGKYSPGKDFHVFMQPLIKDMMQLWTGVDTYDACTGVEFKLHAAFIWSIHDYPGYATMSGRSTRGFYACVHCEENPCYESLKNKVGYIGHRRFLPANHPFRKSKLFNGLPEKREAPRKFTSIEVMQKLERVKDYKPGKNPEHKKRKRAEKGEPTWHLKVGLYDLPYWSHLKLAHNLDVMHIEKNICENILGTLLEIEGKNKDTVSARLDLKKFKIRKKYWMNPVGDSFVKPPAPWTLDKEGKKKLCKFLANVKFPDGYAANLARCVDLDGCKVHGLKTHDCHILLQRLLPAGLKGIVPKDMYEAIAELGRFFRELCAKTLRIDVLNRLKAEIPVILCKLEKIFPPAFFDVMVHLAIHLPDEAILRGPVQYGWMYPVERRLGYLKGTVRNRARLEGSIAEGYIVDECLTFCSRYLNDDIETRFNKDDRNKDKQHQVGPDELGIFVDGAKAFGHSQLKYFDKEFDKMVWYVLNNCPEAQGYMQVCREELMNRGVNNIDEELEKEFPDWFEKHVRHLNNVSDDLRSLSLGPDRRVVVHSAYNVNGARFRTVDREKHRRTQNSGIMTNAYFKDREETEYYGVLKEILELQYGKNKHGNRSIFLFRCDWFDLDGKNTKMQDDGFFKSVNTSTVRYKNDPFILAGQAKTCFYLDDTKLGNPWKVVQTFSHRHVYDVLENEDSVDQGSPDAYQEDISSSDRIVHEVEDEDDEEDVLDTVDCLDARIVLELDRQDGNNNEDIDSSEDEQRVDTLVGNTSDDGARNSENDSDDE